VKYGVFGGTFDPIHMGHLRTAEEMVEQLGLAKLFLIPAASPPHKYHSPVSDFRHRYEMARIAVGKSSTLEVLDIEAKRDGPSYSVDTINELISLLGPQDDLYFILGIEGFLEIHTWKEYRYLFTRTHIVVVDRQGHQYDEVFSYLRGLEIHFELTKDPDKIILGTGRLLLHRSSTRMDISSSQIRDLVRKGRSIRYLVPDQVMDYVVANRLYR